jgi:DNA helicase HerA-like ATPase
MKSDFEEQPKGVVVSMEEEAFAGHLYNIWFPYTRENIKKIREGMFLAVKNFQSDEKRLIFSILEVVSVLPQHYALGSSSREVDRAFPGFFLEAAKSCRQDWEQDEPVEQTTLIKVQAISTGLQVPFQGGSSSKPQPEQNYPMIGEEAHILSVPFTDMIINQGLESPTIPTITPCNLLLNPKIGVHISIEDMLRTHFGIFGFTGAGKSNIMSTILSDLMHQGSTKKLVLMDLMSEYTGLLIDVIDQFDDSYIIVFGEDSLPGGDLTLNYLTSKEKTVEEENAAVESIQRTLLLPKELIDYRDFYGKKFRKILQDGKIRVYEEANVLTFSRIRADILSRIRGLLGKAGKAERPIRSWIDANLSGNGEGTLTPDRIEELLDELDEFLDQNTIPESFLSERQSEPRETLSWVLETEDIATSPRHGGKTVSLSDTARGAILTAKEVLSRYVSNTQEERPGGMLLSFDQIYRILNSNDCSSIIIFQCNRDDELRERTSSIVNQIFNLRRSVGAIDPTILFVYDEADEFIPQNPTDSYRASLGAVRNIARRGRKFGLGLTIATQRVAYLDTSTLAQPHTYLISKMPREYDRKAMAAAFGITDDMMKKTLKFTKGQWLLVSYDATGLANVPIPVSFPNANDRIIRYLLS